MVKYAPRKVYIRESGGYVESDFTLGKSVKKDCLYQLLFTIRQQRQGGFQPVHHDRIDNGDKLFIPIQGCLLEVVREQYTDFYRDKERWRYLQKLDTKT